MVIKREDKNLIIVCGGEKEDLSFKNLNSQFKDLKPPQTEIVRLKSGQIGFDETLKGYAFKRDLYKEIVVVILRSEMIVGLIGLGYLFDKGAFCLIEAESDEEESSFALTFLQTGKAHLELKTSEMGELIQLFFKNPEEVKAFFHDEI